MAAKKKEPLCLADFSNGAIEAEAERRYLIPESDINDFTDDELLDEMADRGILPKDLEPELLTPKDFTTEELMLELRSRPGVEYKQTGLSVRTDIQIAGRPVCKSYGPHTIIWKRD